jgi:hypothetical protein
MAGNLNALLKVRQHLSTEDQEMILARAQNAVLKSATREGAYTNWVISLDSFRGRSIHALQWCHGGPGFITSLEAFPKDRSPDLESDLIRCGNLIWDTGPLSNPFGICHGNAGNSLALLQLYARTGDQLWLERSRQLACHAAAQSEQMTKEHGRRRYPLLTGDLGLAFALWQNIQARAGWPLLEVF